MKLLYLRRNKNIYALFISMLLFLCIPSIALSNNLKTALEAFHNGELEKAQQVIDTLVPIDQSAHSAKGWYYRGVIYDQLMRTHITSDLSAGYLDEALNAYRKTLKCGNHDPQYHRFAEIHLEEMWNYYINRSVQYYKMEYFEEALEQLEIARQINPAAKLMILYNAIINHQMGVYDEALEGYTQYLKTHSQDAALYRILADLTIHYQRDIHKAQTLLQTALQTYPWNYNLLEDYYELLATNQLLQKQQHHLEKQLRNESKNPLLYYQLAHLHQKLNRYEEAIVNAKKALALAPSQPEAMLQTATLHYNFATEVIHSTLALSEETLQQHKEAEAKKCHQAVEEAITYLKEARKAHPKNIYILQQLRLLYKWLGNEKRAEIIAYKMENLKGGSELIEEMEAQEREAQKREAQEKEEEALEEPSE